MNSVDKVSVSITDTAKGERTTVHDKTTGKTGSMTASAGNGVAQVKYDATGTIATRFQTTSTRCTARPVRRPS
jgi:hypothetical protein